MAKQIKIKSSASERKGEIKSRLDIAKSNSLKIIDKNSKGRSSISFSKDRRKWIFKKLRKVGLVFLAVFSIILFAGGVYAYSYVQKVAGKTPSPESITINNDLSTVLYDRRASEDLSKGTKLFKIIGDTNSDLVDIKQIPEKVKWAFLAAEDKDFYTHDGFNAWGILRCGYIIAKSFGKEKCGGSTVTQQVLKLKIFSKDQNLSTIDRKIQELILSQQIEQKYDKDTILQMYLSVAPFGGNIQGLTTASRFYFGKEPKDLTLAQATILASIINDPSDLSPTQPWHGDTKKSQAAVKERQKYVLEQMSINLDHINNQIRTNKNDDSLPDQITQAMIDLASSQKLTYKKPIATDKLAGHFVDYAVNELLKRNYKNGEEPFLPGDLQNGGYTVITSLDYSLQKIAEEQVKKGGNNYKYWNVHNAAVLTIRPQNGEILVMAGSKDFNGASEGCDKKGQNCKFNGEVNYFTSLQSVGSTNKPLAYYIGYEKGIIYPGSLLPDVPIKIGSYEPKNWDSRYRGVGEGANFTARYMLNESRNMPALTAIDAIGVNSYIDTAEKLGYTSYGDRANLGHSLVLGGADTYPLEHAAAFSMFANTGDYVKPNPILKILDREGKVVYQASPERKKVGNPQAAFLLNQTLLRSTDHFGRNCSWDGRDVACKTGTTESSQDALLVMYSPDFVTLGWAANNNNDPLDQNNGFPGAVVSPWLFEYMSRIGGSSYLSPKTAFKNPGFVYRGGGKCNKDGECLGTNDWLIQGKTPPAYIIKKTLKVCSDQPDRIAREIDIQVGKAINKTFIRYKDASPKLQTYVDKYLKGKNTIPTEFCNKNRGDLPLFNTLVGTFNGTNLNIKGSAVTPTQNAIVSAKFTISGFNLNACDVVANFNNFDVTCSVAGLDLPSGNQALVGTVTDSVGAVGTKSVTVNVPSGLVITTPSAPENVNQGQPYTISFTNAQYWNLQNIRVYYVKNGNVAGAAPIPTFGGNANWVIPADSVKGDKFYFFVLATNGNGNARMQSANSAVITVK